MDLILGMVIGIISGSIVLWFFLSITSNKKLLKAREMAKKLLEESRAEAESLKKEKMIEVQEELLEHKQKLEKDLESRKEGLLKKENMLDQRELEIDRKAEMIEKKEKDNLSLQKKLSEKEQYIIQKTDELNSLISEQVTKLEELSGMSREEALNLLLKDMEEEARQEGNKLINRILDQAKLEANRKALEVVVSAIQQIAAEQSAEATVSVVNLPNDDMKGRIIGREGRNIRAFENGRIHPARIEEVVQKTEVEIKESFRDVGEQAMLEAGVHGLPDEVIELIGKLKYLTSYGQNVLNHCLEVAYLTGIMASELGLDPKIAKRAGLLHDIGKAIDRHTDAPHSQIGADLLKKFNENPQVIDAIEFHHFEENAASPYTVLVAAADSISGSRPGARRETLETFIKRMRSMEDIAMKFEGVEKVHAIQAGREVRIIANCLQIDDNRSKSLAREIAQKIQEDSEFPGQIKVTVIREFRSSDIAT